MKCRRRHRWTALVTLLFAVAIGSSLAASAIAAPERSSDTSQLEGALVVPDSPTAAEQIQAQQNARRENPVAVAERKASRTRFKGLDAQQSATLAGEAFASAINEPAGGAPTPPTGERLTGTYPTDDSAQVELPEGKHGVLAASTPIAVETSPGTRTPVNLSLNEVGAAFEPTTTIALVRIPKQLSEGAALTAAGVSLTPVDASGTPLTAAEGTLDGAAVFYGGVSAGNDVDVAIKPLTLGFEEDTILRSAESPEELYFRVGLPEGASLESTGTSARVVKEGATLATIPTPSAQDAAGSEVPVTMSVSTSTLTLSVSHRTGSWAYPIMVDPTAIASNLSDYNWEFTTGGGFSGSREGGRLVDEGGGFEKGQYGLWGYETTGESHIYDFISETEASGEGVENELAIVNPGKVKEALWTHPVSYGKTRNELCVQSGCAAGKVESANETNVAYFTQINFEGVLAKVTSKMSSGSIYILQEKPPTPKFNFEQEISADNNQVRLSNVLYKGGWLGPHNNTGFEPFGDDPGIGANEWKVTTSAKPEWEVKGSSECVVCRGGDSVAFSYESEWVGLNSTKYTPLPDGEDVVQMKAHDAAGLEGLSEPETIKVDGTPPHSITLTGLPANEEIDDGVYHLKASATDGSGTTPSSGVESIALKVDGKKIGSSTWPCSPGPCTATGEWTISGSEFGVGPHEVTVTATDKANNSATEKFKMFVAHPTSPVAIGPGSFEPQSGEFRLSSTDVSVAAPGAPLTVSRSYGSLHAPSGAEGPLGPQWSLSLQGSESLAKLPNGNIALNDGTDLETVFTAKGAGEFTAPKGDENLLLSEKGANFTLTDSSGAVTTFTPSGVEAGVWLPTVHEQASGLDASKITYQAVGQITEPTEMLAPPPPGVSCASELVKGCRALKFIYATKTTATGDSENEWGDYEGHLKEITLTAWERSSGKMVTKTEAQYTFDKQGRLRAEWDPLITPSLEVKYGYNSDGQIVALSPPGHEPWLATYGTIAGDVRTGRLLALTRPSAHTALGNGIAPSNTSAPSLSTTTPVEGTPLSVSTGSWSNSPLSYEYQWERCHTVESKETCTPILGATNPSYAPVTADRGYELLAKVTAVNADGAVTATSDKSSVASEPAIGGYERTLEFGSEGTGEGQLKKPVGAAVDRQGNVWVADTANNRIEKFSSTGKLLATYGKEGSENGQFKEPKAIAIDREGYVFVADAGNKRIQVLNSSGEYHSQLSLPSAPAGITTGRMKLSTGYYIVLYVALPGLDRIQTFTFEEYNHKYTGSPTQFGSAGSGNGQFSGPTDVALNPAAEALGEGEYLTKGRVFVTDTGNHRVQVLKFTSEGGSLEYSTQFGKNGSEPGQMSAPTGIVVEPSGGIKNLAGDVLVDDPGDGRFQLFSESYGYLHQFPEKEAQGFALDPSSQALYLANTEKSVISKWTSGVGPEPAPEPPNPGSSAVTTIDYHVPVSGEGAPQAMGAKEVEAWGQTDDPVEATAVFPPDEPMGWPAKDYKRASIYYLDAKGHTVNTASPSGGIGTVEYNATNDVSRTLSADNRAAALGEGSKSKEVSKLLDSESKYNSTGTELLSTLGPQHKVKLAHGKEKAGEEVLARDHEQLSYNEGAPEGSYNLVTKTVEGALTASGEEFDKRETKTAFSGQNNLGWKLRKPTSTTTDPGGENLVKTAAYDEHTGDPTETTMPAGAQENPVPLFSSSFASGGSGAGQVSSPNAITLAQGNLWVSDKTNDRVDVFSASTRAFVKAIGWGVADGKAELETCTTTCRAGLAGAGTGELQEPGGITYDSQNEHVYVSDTGNHRVAQYTTEGGFVDAWGWGVKDGKSELETCTATTTCKAGTSGSGQGQLATANGLTQDSSGHVVVADGTNADLIAYSAEGAYVATYGKKGKGNGEFEGANDVVLCEGALYAVDYANRVEKFSGEGKYESQFGKTGKETGQFTTVARIGCDPKNGDLYVADRGEKTNRVDVFSQAGVYLGTFGSEGSGAGQFKEPVGIAFTAAGEAFVIDRANNRVETWKPGNPAAHTSQTIYFTAKEEASVQACQNHPEWAGLPCQTEPAKQPETNGLPNLPVTTFAYNYWLEVSEEKETVGSSTRTRKASYDEAGRPKTNTVESTVGTAQPQVSIEYNPETGAAEKQTAEGKTITVVQNKLGEPISYTDADGNTSTAEWDIDGRAEKTSDGKGTQSFSYDPTTGFLTKLVDSAAGTFTASEDVEGHVLNEGYPNGMTATYTLNQLGAPTGLEYKKTTHCSENCTWFSDVVVPSIQGQWLEQTSTLSHQAYEYKKTGVLGQVQNTPAGKGCTTRDYANEPDTNRTSLTTREPNAKGECTSEGGTTEFHAVDSADRLTDPGVAYNPFGDITALPAPDAGGSELTSAFYVDNQLQSQTQNGETIGYNLDPSGRTRETVATGKTNQDLILHYAGGGSSPAWMLETPSGKWTRNIGGIGGGLVAVQNNGEAPVLELSNLHGDIIGTASLSETESKPLSMTDSSEYGVPATSTPPKYGWLGTDAVATELPSGVIAMGARSYVPQLGRYLQPDPIEGGSANAYTYVFGDPVNNSDPSGAFAAWFTEFSKQNAIEVAEAAAAREAAARAAAEQAAKEAAAAENARLNAALFAREAEIHGEMHQAEAEAAGVEASGGGEEEGGGLPTVAKQWAQSGEPFAVVASRNEAGSDPSGGYGESECNRTGQNCTGRKNGYGKSPNTGLQNACELVGVSVPATAFAKVSATIIATIFGGSEAAAVVCRELAG